MFRTIALIAAFDELNRLLLLKRPDDAHCGGLWSLPGGKVEGIESPLAAAVRELREECSLEGRLWRHVAKHEYTYPDVELHFLLFACRVEHDALACPDPFVWIALDRLADLPMPEANSGLIPALLEAADYYARSE